METKPFFKTSEFWVLILAQAGNLIASLEDAYPGKWAAVAGGVLAGLYAVARGIAKQGIPYQPPPPPPS